MFLFSEFQQLKLIGCLPLYINLCKIETITEKKNCETLISLFSPSSDCPTSQQNCCFIFFAHPL